METKSLTLVPGPIVGTVARGGSGLPSDQPTPAVPPEPQPAATLPRGSVWSAQIGQVTLHDFVLLIGGMPFDIVGHPPAPEGATLVVRVVEATSPPLLEVVVGEPQVQSAALRALLAHVLKRATTAASSSAHYGAAVEAPTAAPDAIATALRHGAREQLTQPSSDLVRYLETGLLRLDVTAPAEAPLRWHVEIHDERHQPGESDETVRAAVFVDLPEAGTVEARLALSHGRLDVTFLTASESTCEWLLERADELSAALTAAGFAAVDVHAHADPARLARDRVADEPPREALRAGGLLDIRA